ncbi:mannose-1-phosphate guanylyltransferase/mannose-6-phosphate isomerase [Rickettsiella endosymbiont of Miltochrista miniata]|uniref:mannose-1-phosphate guanylyltransferase/mannose-6-phosphate isomerase n=1 Tax=Rickettsiella endosymbiont of Miltochrista miniata TaxID=3066239 RepID=UPI00313EDCCA
MLVPVVLSGGNGSRLWPVSREAHPKPFIRLNNDPYSLIQKTYQRAVNLPNVEKIITVTNFEYYYQSKKELSDLGLAANSKEFNFILEPCSRNTAAAIVFSALFIKEMIDPEAILLVLPADHIILNQDKFNSSIAKAYQLAKKNLLTTFGIIPHKPETAYGYIQYFESKELNSAFKVVNFFEKPKCEEAKSFIEQGNYLWNSGIFCFSVKAFLQAIKQYAPELYLKASNCWKLSIKQNNNFQDKIKLEKESFSVLENISIDYALMEKAQNIAVLPADFGWSDVGSWDALNTLLEPSEHGNRIVGNAFLKETHNTTIYSQNSPGRLIAVLGVKNLTIVDTIDALLICEQDQVQKVKQVVEELKLNGQESYRYHQTVYRPWGHYTILDQGLNYKLKRLIVHAGASLSLQMHQYRSEYWVVVAGTATVENDQKKIILKEQESTFIALGHKHCLSNFDDQDLILIELQIGSYLGEDDIIRFRDNYDREHHTISKEENLCH